MTDNAAIIRANCLRLADGDVDKALDLAAAAVDYYWTRTSPGYIREDPRHHVRPPKPPPDAILTHDGH